MSALLLQLITPVVVLYVGLRIGDYIVRSQNMRQADKDRIYYTVTYPRDMEPEQMTDWHRSVESAMPPGKRTNRNESSVVLEWGRNDQGITHVIGVPVPHKELMGQLTNAIQGVHFKELEKRSYVEWTVAREYGISDSTHQLDVKRLTAQVNAVLGSGLYEHKAGDEVRVQLVMKPSGHVTANQSLTAWFFGHETSKEMEADQKEKIASPTFNAVLRIVVKSETEAHAKYILKNIERSYARADTAHVHLKSLRFRCQANIIDRLKRGATTFMVPAMLNSNEVIAFSAVPIAGVAAPGLTVGKTRWFPPGETIPRDGVVLGTAAASGYSGRPIGVSHEDLFRHLLIQGGSGNGKTTLLGNLFQIQAEKGYQLTLFETKGDLFHRALNSIPKERIDDVIVIDLSDDNYSAGLNILHEGDARNTIDTLVNLFVQGAPDPKLFDKAARSGWQTLRLIPGTTVVDLIPLLDPSTDDERAWQEWVISQIPKNDPVQTFWREHMSRRESDRRNRVAPVSNRLYRFDIYPPMRRFLGQSKSTFSLRDAVRDGKIILVYAPFEVGSEPVSFLISLLMMELRRVNREVKDIKLQPSFALFDEVQRLRYMPIDFAELLSLLRADRLGLEMANQYMGQLAPDVQLALTNVGTMIATRLDGTDARHWQQYMGNNTKPEDTMNLDPFHALGRVALPGGVSEPVEIALAAPFRPHGHAVEIRKRSRQQFERPAADIDAEIRKRRQAPAKPKPARPTINREAFK